MVAYRRVDDLSHLRADCLYTVMLDADDIIVLHAVADARSVAGASCDDSLTINITAV